MTLMVLIYADKNGHDLAIIKRDEKSRIFSEKKLSFLFNLSRKKYYSFKPYYLINK